MSIALPTEKTEPKTSLTDLTTLIYGQPKIGKSTFCSSAPGAIFLATEAGLNHLSTFQIPITSWADFLEAYNLLKQGNHQFSTVIIDTIDNLYKMCADCVLKAEGLKHESDAPYGKGFAMVNGQFQRGLTALSLLPYGLIMTSHAQEREVKTPTGTENRIAPTLPGSARKIVLGMSDLILYAEIREVRDDSTGKITGYERVLHTQPTTIYEAGARGYNLPDTLPLDYGAFTQAIINSAAPKLCEGCQKEIIAGEVKGKPMSAHEIAATTKRVFGAELCLKCAATKAAEREEAKRNAEQAQEPAATASAP